MPWICIPEKVHEGTGRFDFDFRGFVDFLKLIGGIFLKQTVLSCWGMKEVCFLLVDLLGLLALSL